jgi:acyl-CoA thioester hydrolase
MPSVYCYPLTVPPSAVDPHGHANNQEYLRWMQEAAVAHSTAQGWPMKRYFAQGQSWYVKSHHIDYEQPAFEDDEVHVVTWVAGFTERTSPRRYLILRARGKEILARAETVWIYMDIRTGKAIPIPKDMHEAFDVVESEEEALRLYRKGDLVCDDGGGDW